MADIVGSLFIGFRKAFDVVDHTILIKKLSSYKLSESALQYFESDLKNRTQTVHNDHTAVNVPLGSILGPILLLLLINDMPLYTKFCFSDFYADDAMFQTHSKNRNAIVFNIQNDGDAVNSWCRKNKMHLKQNGMHANWI